jgi:SNF2 family DNA or RNA helicase
MPDAAKAVNADFSIAMTGTPVENRLADLWCIADTAQPGILGDLKSFSRKYESEESEQNLFTLKEKIWHSPSRKGIPGLMIRRMKEDALDALPKKHIHPLHTKMPAYQANAYSNAVAQAHKATGSGILQALHHLRSVSLHPFTNQSSNLQSDEDYIRSSARLSATINVLDEIKTKDEKALIFLESLDMQDAMELPLILKTRYRLESLPLVINGTVAAPDRHKRVGMFQSSDGFDVMLLSPRAGGVGLTLTAANHVIHLSRWWNPAVEDQSTDRVYRIGQQRDVHVYYPIAVHPQFGEHSFDIKLHDLIEKKRALSKSLLVPPSASSDEVNQLFSQTVTGLN